MEDYINLSKKEAKKLENNYIMIGILLQKKKLLF